MRESLIIFLLLMNGFYLSSNDAFNEFKIKRKNIFEFTKKPELMQDKNSTTISFAVKDYCDVTVAIENSEGKIIRHLASGVLGEKAPQPFKINSLEQTLVWDHKDDRGIYPLEKVSLKVRVSLGLQAEYEKDLHYSPYKRLTSTPLVCASPEGIYVFEGKGRDHLRLFGHDGAYIKTIYPFPASQIKKIEGLKWVKGPDGELRPEKESNYHLTLLTSGDNDGEGDKSLGTAGMNGLAATGLAVKNKRIALAYENLNRIGTDGSSGSLPLKGGKTIGISVPVIRYGGGGSTSTPTMIGPTSLAFSPDSKSVYITGFLWENHGRYDGNVPAVFKMNYETNEDMSIFVGDKSPKNYGSDEDHLSAPTSVDTDNAGNVYISDYANHRIQVFEPSGKFLKSLSVKFPAKVLVNQKTGEINVFSWGVFGLPLELSKKMNYDIGKVPQKISIFTPFPEMKIKHESDFPLGPSHRSLAFAYGQAYFITLDSWAENPTFWVVGRKFIVGKGDDLVFVNKFLDPKYWEAGIRVVQFKNKKWEDIVSFNENAKKEIIKVSPPSFNNQELFFNPKNEKLYVAEPDFKYFKEMMEIDPISTKAKMVKLPWEANDIDFDINGLIYLRDHEKLARFDLNTGNEIAFDYGTDGKGMISYIMLPSHQSCNFMTGGVSVNVNGDIALACHLETIKKSNNKTIVDGEDENAAFTAAQYPGRLEDNNSVEVSVWDKYGKPKSITAIQGSAQMFGVSLDKNNNIYVITELNRLIEGKAIDDGNSATLMKFNKTGKFLTKNGTALPMDPSGYLDRPLDVNGQWAENVEWFYGAVGSGKLPCTCWFVRFKQDYYGRIFVPAPLLYEVAVLDTEGNLILKIGKYGNEDSKGKNSKEPLGSDEVGLFHPSFVATHTDRRLFISDIGNERIVSVKLKYAVDETLSLDLQK